MTTDKDAERLPGRKVFVHGPTWQAADPREVIEYFTTDGLDMVELRALTLSELKAALRAEYERGVRAGFEAACMGHYDTDFEDFKFVDKYKTPEEFLAEQEKNK